MIINYDSTLLQLYEKYGHIFSIIISNESDNYWSAHKCEICNSEITFYFYSEDREKKDLYFYRNCQSILDNDNRVFITSFNGWLDIMTCNEIIIKKLLE